jgi:hypothetical protein
MALRSLRLRDENVPNLAELRWALNLPDGFETGVTPRQTL